MAVLAGPGAWLLCLLLTPTIPSSCFSPAPEAAAVCAEACRHASLPLRWGRQETRLQGGTGKPWGVSHNAQPKQPSVQAFLLLISPPFCSGFQEMEKGGNMFRRKPPRSQCLRTVLLNQPGTMPSSGKNKACASLSGAEFDKSSAANLAALAYCWRPFQSRAWQSQGTLSPAHEAQRPGRARPCPRVTSRAAMEQAEVGPGFPKLHGRSGVGVETRAAARHQDSQQTRLSYRFMPAWNTPQRKVTLPRKGICFGGESG